MGDVNLEIKINNLEERVDQIEPSSGVTREDLDRGLSTKIDKPALTIPSGKILTSDGAGGVNWEDAPSGEVTEEELTTGLATKINKPDATIPSGKILTSDGAGGVNWSDEPEFDLSIVTDKYKDNVTYNKGSYCIYDNKLYKCKNNNTINILPTNETYWEYVTITGEIGTLNDKTNWKSVGEVTKGGTPIYFNNIGIYDELMLCCYGDDNKASVMTISREYIGVLSNSGIEFVSGGHNFMVSNGGIWITQILNTQSITVFKR